MKSGKLRWRAEFATDTHWYERYLDLFVVGSPAAILGVSIADGKVVWQVACADNRARFSGFQFVDGRLYCLHGLSRVMAVDAASGGILWIAHAPRARQVLTELQAGFLPCYLATADLVLIYSEFGTVLALDAASGRVKAELQPVGIVASQGLPSVPLLFPAAKVIVLALDQDHVIAIDFVTGAERWRSTLPFGANRVGAWPTLARAGGQSNEVVVASHLNFGFLAQQLDARTGKPSTVKDGRVATIDQTVSPPSRRLDPRAARLKFEVLLFSLECTMEPVNAAGGFNLSVHDEKTGKLSQRLDLHAERSPMFESFNLELRPSWRLQASQLPAPTAMTIYCGSDGMMVSRGRNVWRLIPKPTP
jgi:outer membrane protein assembly factor BamB